MPMTVGAPMNVARYPLTRLPTAPAALGTVFVPDR